MADIHSLDAQTDSVPATVRIRNAEAARARYGDPAQSLTIIGVTGTNGKTTTVNILRAILHRPETPAASIGTLGVLVGTEGDTIPGGLGLTTPGPDELQRVLRALADGGISTVVMEVSSHALDQRRIHGIAFDAAVFTNLTRDHLDYHKTMQSYFAAKARLISYLKPGAVAVINSDDPAWMGLPDPPRRLTFGLASGDVRATDVAYTNRGSSWLLHYSGHATQVHLPLIGDFNVSNALAAAATALALGRTLQEIAPALSQTPQVPGRLELLAESPTVIRDYAHTPDALQRTLAALRPLTSGRIIVVFGAGGDRDAGKRPLMGAVAQRDADVAIVTSDNPRTESPDVIIADIERGMTVGAYERIPDRRTAIAQAIAMATQNDIILLAGKGHETYQIIGTERHHFDEREIVNEILASR